MILLIIRGLFPGPIWKCDESCGFSLHITCTHTRFWRLFQESSSHMAEIKDPWCRRNRCVLESSGRASGEPRLCGSHPSLFVPVCVGHTRLCLSPSVWSHLSLYTLWVARCLDDIGSQQILNQWKKVWKMEYKEQAENSRGALLFYFIKDNQTPLPDTHSLETGVLFGSPSTAALLRGPGRVRGFTEWPIHSQEGNCVWDVWASRRQAFLAELSDLCLASFPGNTLVRWAPTAQPCPPVPSRAPGQSDVHAGVREPRQLSAPSAAGTLAEREL